MGITPEQREERRRFIGSSDAPAIAGLDPWRSAFAVYMEKVYGVRELDIQKPSIARGNRYESALVDWAEEELGEEIERNVTVYHPDGICLANLDGRVKGKRIGVEAKVTSLADEFGEANTDLVPDRIIVQAHHQMRAGNLDLVLIPVLLSRFGRPEEAMFRVERNEQLIEVVGERAATFWNEHVIPKIPPPAEGPPAIEVLKRLLRVPGSVVGIEAELVQRWEAAKAARKEAILAAEEAEQAMLAALGGAEAGDFGSSTHLLTYYEQTVKEHVRRASTFRVPRVQKRPGLR